MPAKAKTWKANARLIASAPELYEALLMAEKELAGLTDLLGPDRAIRRTLLAIRAALAKARGEP